MAVALTALLALGQARIFVSLDRGSTVPPDTEHPHVTLTLHSSGSTSGALPLSEAKLSGLLTRGDDALIIVISDASDLTDSAGGRPMALFNLVRGSPAHTTAAQVLRPPLSNPDAFGACSRAVHIRAVPRARPESHEFSHASSFDIGLRERALGLAERVGLAAQSPLPPPLLAPPPRLSSRNLAMRPPTQPSASALSPRPHSYNLTLLQRCVLEHGADFASPVEVGARADSSPTRLVQDVLSTPLVASWPRSDPHHRIAPSHPPQVLSLPRPELRDILLYLTARRDVEHRVLDRQSTPGGGHEGALHEGQADQPQRQVGP